MFASVSHSTAAPGICQVQALQGFHRPSFLGALQKELSLEQVASGEPPPWHTLLMIVSRIATAHVASADTSYPGARASSEREPKASRATVVSDAVADTHGGTGVA